MCNCQLRTSCVWEIPLGQELLFFSEKLIFETLEMLFVKLSWKKNLKILNPTAITCSKSTIETLEKGDKYVKR